MFGWIKESAVYETGLIGSSSWDEESSSYKVQLPAEVLQEAARVMDKGYLFYVHGTIEADGTESEFYLRANKMEANRILFAEGSSLTEGLLTISHFDLTHVETEVSDLMNDVTDLQTAIDERAPIGIVNKANMLLYAPVKYGYYYANGREYVNTGFRYYIVQIENGVAYKVCGARFLSSESATIRDTIYNPTTYTATYTGNLYISVSNTEALTSDGVAVFFCLESDYENVGALGKPTFNPAVLASTEGESVYIPASQKLVHDVKQNIIDNQIDGESENGELSPLVIRGISYNENSSIVLPQWNDGKYAYAPVGNNILIDDNSNLAYIKLNLQGERTLYFNLNPRFVCACDANDKVLVMHNSMVSTAYSISIPSNTRSIYITTEQPNKSILIVSSSSSSSSSRPSLSATFDLNLPNYDNELSGLLRSNANMFTLNNRREQACKVGGDWQTTEGYAKFDTYWFIAEEGVQYIFGCPTRFFTVNETLLYSSGTYAGFTYTPEARCVIWACVSRSYTSPIVCVASPLTVDEVNTVGVATLNAGLIAQETGYSPTLLMSQKAITQALEQGDPTTAKKLYGKGFYTAKGSLADGESFTVPKTNVKKNNVYSFVCKITSYSSVLIGHGTTSYDSSYIEITGTEIISHSYTTTDSVQRWTHGITISDYLKVQIQVGNGTAKIQIYSNGESFSVDNVAWTGDGNAQSFVQSSGSVLTDCVFTWSSGDFRKSVWAFGDSYFGYTGSSRWPYYLAQNGYLENVLLNAYPGENTSAALQALNAMITNYGCPNFIVWCLGMNDETDSNDTPSSAWMSGINTVLSLCETYRITPIFATIPSVPGRTGVSPINHEAKNTWIRESGYRYIDFAKAVGAIWNGENTTWYTGMISDDGIHPDVLGALALYYQAITDCPEFTYSNP